MVTLNKSLSLPASPTAAAATAIDWGDIILAIVPPMTFTATIVSGAIPIWVAVTACSGANREPLLTTDPVRKTPNQPNKGANKGNISPVDAKARPNVEDMPE